MTKVELLERLADVHAPDFIAQLIAQGTTTTTDPDGRLAYISGPMRGYPDLNFPAFDEARNALVSNGWNVINPADIDRAANPHHEAIDHNAAASCRMYALRDFFALMILRPDRGDRIVTLGGWTHSTGARAEVAVAAWLTVPQIDLRF